MIKVLLLLASILAVVGFVMIDQGISLVELLYSIDSDKILYIESVLFGARDKHLLYSFEGQIILGFRHSISLLVIEVSRACKLLLLPLF